MPGIGLRARMSMDVFERLYLAAKTQEAKKAALRKRRWKEERESYNNFQPRLLTKGRKADQRHRASAPASGADAVEVGAAEAGVVPLEEEGARGAGEDASGGEDGEAFRRAAVSAASWTEPEALGLVPCLMAERAVDMAGSMRSIRQRGNPVEVSRDVGHMCCSSAASLRQTIMERRRSVREPDSVVSTEFLPRGGGKITILAISNRRVMCVRAHLPGYDIGEDGENFGGGGGSEGVNGGGGRGRGGRGVLRESGITGEELDRQFMLDVPTVLLALLEEDGARTILHFTRIAGPVPPTSSSRRREVISGLRIKDGTAGMVAILGEGDGAGATAPSNSTTVGGPESNVMGITSGSVGGSMGGSGRSGGKVLRTRGVEGLYRDPPALIRAFNIIACLTDRLRRVLLLPSGVNFSGSKIMSRSHFPTVGVERDPQIAIGGRHGVRSGFLGVMSVNEWEFGEDSRERLSLPGQWATRYNLDGSGTGSMHGSAFPGLGSPREVEEVGERRAWRLSSEQPTPARRSESFAVRGDIPASTDLWVPLWLLMRQRNLALSDKMRPVPYTFEMDAVVWKPGPFPPETDLGSGRLLAPRSSALRAPNDLERVAMDSELMLDGSPKALEVMGVLRQSETFRMETVRPNVPETAKSALITPCMTVSATSSTLTIVGAWGGKDAAAVGGRGTDSGRDPETGATQGQIRPQVSTFTVLGKLGGRSVPGLEADEMGSGVLGSPSQDGGGADRVVKAQSSSNLLEHMTVVPSRVVAVDLGGDLGAPHATLVMVYTDWFRFPAPLSARGHLLQTRLYEGTQMKVQAGRSSGQSQWEARNWGGSPLRGRFCGRSFCGSTAVHF